MKHDHMLKEAAQPGLQMSCVGRHLLWPKLHRLLSFCLPAYHHIPPPTPTPVVTATATAIAATASYYLVYASSYYHHHLRHLQHVSRKSKHPVRPESLKHVVPPASCCHNNSSLISYDLMSPFPKCFCSRARSREVHLRSRLWHCSSRRWQGWCGLVQLAQLYRADCRIIPQLVVA